jgi:MurNAc alpha-1-phosphate uridylyltransferase
VDTFAVVNSDVYSDYDYDRLSETIARLDKGTNPIAHLVLVDNPAHHPHGDFSLENGSVLPEKAEKLTFSGLAVYRREMFASISSCEKKPLAPLLQEQIRSGRVSGEHYTGRWADIGTPERLASLNNFLEREAS